MKNIKISNGNLINAYEFTDLDNDSQSKVLDEQINFEIDIMNEDSIYYYLVEEMEKMHTPWFLGSEIYHKHKSDLIENININGYLFDEEGEILPIQYHMKGNKIVKMTYGRKQYLAQFI